ncbi:MAG: MBOAT family protein, partial [Anaerorhabdus sp.]
FGTNGAGFANGYTVYILGANILVFIACIIGSTTLYDKTLVDMKKKSRKLVNGALPVVQVVTFLICIAFLVTATYNPFLYFRF